MGKFNFSPEALDEGLTQEDVEEFDVTFRDFKVQVQRVHAEGANAENVVDAYRSWIKIGEKLLGIFGKVVAQKAVQVEPPNIRQRLTQAFQDRISPVISDFFRERSK